MSTIFDYLRPEALGILCLAAVTGCAAAIGFAGTVDAYFTRREDQRK